MRTSTQGYWPELGGGARKFYKCLNTACNGLATLCDVGYGGNLCTVCERGSGRTGRFDCVECPDEHMNRFRVIGAVIAMGLLLSLIGVDTITQQKKPVHQTLIKLVLSNVQMNGLAYSLDFEWPSEVDAMLSVSLSSSSVSTPPSPLS